MQRAVITVDPEGRGEASPAGRAEGARIRFWHENSGTCGLQGTGLPTDQALAAHANIEARALEYKAVPIQQKIDILRVMAYLDILNGVTVDQRIAWAQADEEARQAEAEAAARAERRRTTRQPKGTGSRDDEEGDQGEGRQGDGSTGGPGGSGPEDGGNGGRSDSGSDGDGPDGAARMGAA